MREHMEKFLAEAEDEHTRNQAVYHKAQKQKKNADKALRAACEVASVSANNVAMLRQAVAKMPPAPTEEAA